MARRSRPPVLSAVWINERIERIVEVATTIVQERILTEGLLYNGYLPGEIPLTDAMLARMSAEELRLLLPKLTYEQQLLVLKRVEELK